MTNIDDIKAKYRDTIITYLKCVSIINHSTVLTGDFQQLVDCVWMWFEVKANIAPMPLIDSNIKIACEEVVGFYLSGEIKPRRIVKELQEFSEAFKPCADSSCYIYNKFY